jgi:broad specificity phosphatase PhoE
MRRIAFSRRAVDGDWRSGPRPGQDVVVQMLLIRHALPLRSEPGEGSDPHLSDIGFEQAKRLPPALARHPISRLVSSPQHRAMQTVAPVAEALGLSVHVDDRFAEYDRDLSTYIPIEQVREEYPQEWARISDGHLPSVVDERAFRVRVAEAVDDVVAGADHAETVAVFSHGGVINVILHDVLETARLLSFPIDYASVTRLLYSRTGRATVVEVNGTEHVWDLLPRNRR